MSYVLKKAHQIILFLGKCNSLRRSNNTYTVKIVQQTKSYALLVLALQLAFHFIGHDRGTVCPCIIYYTPEES